MTEGFAIGWILLAGVGIGLFYFGGLWLTVRQLTKTKYPGLLFLGSFVGRTAVSLAGFYWAMANQWERAVLLVVGFLLARLFTVHYWGACYKKDLDQQFT